MGLLFYNYYIYNKVLLEECDKQEQAAVKWGCYCFLFDTMTVKRSAQCHVLVQSPPDRRNNQKYPNTLHRSLFVYKCLNAVLFGSNGNSYSLYAEMCTSTHILHNIQTLVGQKEQEKNGTAGNAACHSFVSPGIVC